MLLESRALADSGRAYGLARRAAQGGGKDAPGGQERCHEPMLVAAYGVAVS